MFIKRWMIRLLLGLLLLLASGATAVTHAADSSWSATYWNNQSLSGDPVLTRSETNLDHDWGDRAPDGVARDNFSARWTRTINVAAGTYRFTATMDDGMRVLVDDALIIGSWWDSQVHSISVDYYLQGGDHRLKVEYYEAGGKAVARFNYAPVSGPGTMLHWRGEYFNNTSLAGDPALVRDDVDVNFNWGGGSPAWGTIGADQFSVRWMRIIPMDNGRYRFTTITDDGVRLWVNGQLIIDKWMLQADTTHTGEIDLNGGNVSLQVEYFENNGGAEAHLSWERISDGSSPPANAWRGQYFNDAYLSSNPTFVRDDAAVDFNWGYHTPGSGLGVDNFSVRWTRNLWLNGRYRFTVTSDDGVRLWLDNALIIDKWFSHAAQTYTADVYLVGTIPLKLEYFEASGLAEVHLDWTLIDQHPPGTGGPYTAFVNTASLNIRQGPGLAYGVITRASQGTAVTLTHRNHDASWVRVILPSGTQGWMSAVYLTGNLEPFTSLPLWIGSQSDTPTAIVANCYKLNVRTGPGVGNPVVAVIGRGIRVSLTGYRSVDGRWVKIILPSGAQGWVNGRYLNTEK